MKLKLVILTAAAATLLTSMAAPVVNAQQSSGATQSTSATANSLRISPVRTDLALDPGASKEIAVSVQNLSPQAVQVKAVVSDFEASRDESGEPLIILDDTYAASHSLKRLAIVTPAILSLQPNERASVKLIITAPKAAIAGGYYGAVRFLPADQASPDGNGVAVSTNLGSLVLLRVNGDVVEKMTLESMDVRQKNKVGTFFKTPKDLQIVTRFNNKGNIQEQPFGKIQLLKNGKLVSEYEVNNTDPRGNVLPDSIRRFNTSLKKVSNFGKYTVKGNFSYKNGGEAIASTTTFWVVPVSYMVATGVALVVIILLAVFVPKMVRNYNRKIVSRAGRRY